VLKQSYIFLVSLRGKGPYDDIGRTHGSTGYDEPQVLYQWGRHSCSVIYFVMQRQVIVRRMIKR
jgi:hypothetical protein